MTEPTIAQAMKKVMTASTQVRAVTTNAAINALVTAFKSKDHYFIDLDAIIAEIKTMRSHSPMSAFMLEGTTGQEKAVDLRTICRNDRVRLVEILRTVRAYKAEVSRYIRIVRPYLREILGDHRNRAKVEDDVIFVALDPMFLCMDRYTVAIEVLTDAIRMIDDTVLAIDAWFAIHKQHVFMTANSSNPDEKHERRQEGRRLGTPRR